MTAESDCLLHLLNNHSIHWSPTYSNFPLGWTPIIGPQPLVSKPKTSSERLVTFECVWVKLLFVLCCVSKVFIEKETRRPIYLLKTAV